MPHKREGKTTIYDLPIDIEIFDTIKRAKEEALQTAQKYQITNISSNISAEIDEFEFKSKLKFNEIDEELTEEDYADDESYFMEPLSESHMESNDKSFGEQNENENYANELPYDCCPDSDRKSPFIYVSDEDGVQKLIPKKTFVWMLTDRNAKMSNDRSKRFKMGVKRK